VGGEVQRHGLMVAAWVVRFESWCGSPSAVRGAMK
jgi:hypothetical protein